MLWLRLPRALRARLIIIHFRKLTGANVVRVLQMLVGFIVFAHYLGCFWYAIVIWPLQDDPSVQSMEEWMWIDENPYDTATLYVCSLYWALAVMTNLKGINAHESRQCLWRDPLVLVPLQERLYTIAVFIIGATFYSIIYGNIGQFVSNLYQAGLRYKRRMAEIDEFVRFHNLSPELGKRIRRYVDFAFSVTKGINVDTVASQLPPHLMLDVYLQLNRQMVCQVSIFNGCSDDFYHAVVMKLQPAICTAGDYVFYRGEVGERMYFVKRGRIQVIINDHVVHTFVDTGYFGEIALIADTPRTADLKCVSNVLLLSLSSADLESIFGTYPQSREVFMREASQRLAELEAAQGVKPTMPVAENRRAPSLDAATVITRPKSIGRKTNFKSSMKTAANVQRVARRFSSANEADAARASRAFVVADGPAGPASPDADSKRISLSPKMERVPSAKGVSSTLQTRAERISSEDADSKRSSSSPKMERVPSAKGASSTLRSRADRISSEAKRVAMRSMERMCMRPSGDEKDSPSSTKKPWVSEPSTVEGTQVSAFEGEPEGRDLRVQPVVLLPAGLSDNAAEQMPTLPSDSNLEQLMRAFSLLAAEQRSSQLRQAQQQLEIRQAMDQQQAEMRQVVETLITQVNDISRTLTEASRSQSRWM